MSACTEHTFGDDGVCTSCQHWDPAHDKGPVHLWTRITVCGKPTTWCGAEAVVVGKQVRNTTDTIERCTCEPCKKAEQDVREKYAR